MELRSSWTFYRVLNDAIDLTPGGAELWFDPRQGSDRAFLRALDEFATKSGRAEIATVPWCLWGHSGGGIWANVMSILHPDRVLAAFLRSGTAAMFRPRHEFIQPEVPPAVYEIPTMVNFGIEREEDGESFPDRALLRFGVPNPMERPMGSLRSANRLGIVSPSRRSFLSLLCRS